MKTNKVPQPMMVPLRRFHRYLAAALLSMPLLAVAGTSGVSIEASQVESQPNLMILLSNSASMDATIDNNGFATWTNGIPVQSQCAANYTGSYLPVQDLNDGDTDACGGQGSYFQYGTYGGLPSSKFYIAKQTLYNLLKQGAANGINLGFATYRQAMGMQLSTVQSETNAIYPNIYLYDQKPGEPSSNIGDKTFTQLSNMATNPLNFGFVDWWTVYNSYAPNGTGDGFNGDQDAFLGNGMNSKFQAAPLFGSVNYLDGNNGGGLPYSVQFPSGTLQNSSVNSGNYQYSNYGPGGLTQKQLNDGESEPDLKLCQTYYDSQSNSFQAIYAANLPNGQPQPFMQSFPNKYNANENFYSSLNTQPFVNGEITGNQYEQSCNSPEGPKQVLIGNSYVQLTDHFTNGDPAYFDYIPNVNSGLNNNGGTLSLVPGEATGWTGATDVSSSGVVTSEYPATPEPESILGSYDVSGAKWMGAFVNLPSPSHPVNNAPIIENLVNPAFPMENPSGTEYSYSQQTMTNSSGQSRSIVNSTESPSNNPYQEPLYNSLVDAYAYWSTFEKNNTVAQCQDNNMLIIFDGVSDGDPNMTATQEENALISEAKALYNNLHVKLFVIAIATNSGAISEADKLANAGGTGTAYAVSNSGALYNDLSQTFINIAHEQIHAALSTTPVVSDGSQELAVVNLSQDTGEGDLVAYGIQSDGILTNASSLTTLWDANSLMNNTNRADNILTTNVSDPSGDFYSSGSETSLTNLASADPGDFNLSSGGSLTANDVANYTINPSYNSGIYLGGRQNGWWIGLPANNAPTIISPPDNGNLINNSGYENFAGTHANRALTAVFADNDGLIYGISFNQSNTDPAPDYLWSWMPNGLIPRLQAYNNFWQTGSEDGGLTAVDSNNSAGVWHSYIVGSAEMGNIFYDLQLTGTKTPEPSKTVAEYDLQNAGLSGTLPIGEPPATWMGNNGVVQAAWTLNVTDGGSSTVTPELVLMNVSTGAYARINLSETPTSMPIFNTSGSIYFASGNNLYEISAANVQSAISDEKVGNPSTSTLPSNDVVDIGDMAPYPSTVNGSINRLQFAYSNGANYLLAESPQGLSVLKQNGSEWAVQWLTTTAGAQTQNSGTLVPAPTTGTAAILPLPSGATISDNPLVVNNNIILPVSVQSSADTCGLSTADYIIYNLSSGQFNAGAFVSANNGNDETQIMDIGYGSAYTPSVAAFNGQSLIQSSAANTNSSKVFAASISNGLPIGGAVQEQFIW